MSREFGSETSNVQGLVERKVLSKTQTKNSKICEIECFRDVSLGVSKFMDFTPKILVFYFLEILPIKYFKIDFSNLTLLT